MPRAFIGIDPGASGGIAAKFPSGLIVFKKMPDTLEGIHDLCIDIDCKCSQEGCPFPICAIELVSGFAGVQRPGSRMFNFGDNFGQLKMIAHTLGWAPILVRPQTWQSSLKIPSKGKEETDSQWKNRLKSHATKLFPGLSPTLKTSDALLILYYAQHFLNET